MRGIALATEANFKEGDVVYLLTQRIIKVWKSCRLRGTNYLRPDLKRGLLSEYEEKICRMKRCARETVCMEDEKTISVSFETCILESLMIRLCFVNSGTYLGRAWRAEPHMVYAYTSMTKVVNPAGWSDCNHPEHDKNVAYKEYKCMGPSSSTYNKRNLSKELTNKQVKPFTSLGCIRLRVVRAVAIPGGLLQIFLFMCLLALPPQYVYQFSGISGY